MKIIQKKCFTLQSISVTINSTLKDTAKTTHKFYIVTVVPTLLYVSKPESQFKGH